MNTLYRMFVDGTPLSEGQIKSLISAGLVVRDGNQLKPVLDRSQNVNV